MDKEKEIEEMANIMYNADIIGKLLEFTKIALDNLQKGSGDTNTEFYKDKLFAEELINAGYRKADEVKKETAKEIWEDLLGIIDEGYHRPQVNTTISSPFMNGENCAYKVVIFRMKQALKEKFGIEVGE